ncbi:MAG: hypothetical protein JNJ46_28680 [Myxococcales bacterium]|nr:hypothetical protein [Myxococcales bacterium]
MMSVLRVPQTLAVVLLLSASACGGGEYSVLLTLSDVPSRAVALQVTAQLDQKPLSTMSDPRIPLPLPQNQLGLVVPERGQLELNIQAHDGDGCSQGAAMPTVDVSMRLSNLTAPLVAHSPRRCGTLPACAVGKNCTLAVSGVSAYLRGVWAIAPDDIWVVGKQATILHFDGTAWTQTPTASLPVPSDTIWNAVWASAKNDVWAVGSAGRILHFDGTTWSLSPSGATRTLTAISGVSGKDIWIVGLAASMSSLGEFWRWDGTRWNSINPRGNGDLYAVWAVNPNFVLGGGGDSTQSRLWKWDGVNQFADYSPSAILPVFGLWAQSTSRAIAVGPAGQILRFDGSSWTLASNTIPNDLYSVTSDGTTTYIVGTSGFAVRSVDPLLKTLTALSPGVGTTDMYTVHAAANGLTWLVGDRGYLGFVDGRP